MKFIWNGNESECDVSFVTFSLRHSFLINGGAATKQSSGGLSLQIINHQCLESDFLIYNTSMMDNSGYRGGNMGITLSEFVGRTLVQAVNSVFEGGRAIIGGGIGFTMESLNQCYDIQTESLLFVTNSTIKNNYADRDGGGLLLHTVNACQDILVQISNTLHFINNSVAVYNQDTNAFYSGGAILVYIVRSISPLLYTQLNIVDSIFKN